MEEHRERSVLGAGQREASAAAWAIALGIELPINIRAYNDEALRKFAETKIGAEALTKSIGNDRAAMARSDAQFTRQSNANSQARMRQLEREARDAEHQHERTRRSFLAGIAPGGRRATGVAGLAGAITGGTIAAAPISGSVLSALSTMPALAAGIAPLVGTLPAIGAGALGAAEGVGVLKVATEGLMKVIEADTPKKLQTALQGLDKPTQKLAYAFHKELAPALEDLHELAQKTVLPSLFKLGYAFTQLAKPKGAIFDGMQAAGKSLGKVINSITNLLNDKAFSKQLDQLLVGVGDGIGKLAHILPPMLDLFVRVENLAVPFAERIGTAIGHWADKADDFVRTHGKQVTEFFANAFDVLSTWAHAIGDVAGIFTGLTRAAGDLSHALGGDITRFLDNVNIFINSKQGQHALKNFFADALPTLESFGSLVKDLFVDLGKLGADPATQAFIRGLFDFLRTSLLPVLNDVAKAIPGIGTALLPVMDTLDEFVNVSMRPLVDSLIKLVQQALPPLVPLISNIADLLRTPLQELTSVVQLLTRALGLLQSVTGGGASSGIATIGALLGAGVGWKKLGGGEGGPGAIPNILGFLSAGLYKPKGRMISAGTIAGKKFKLNPSALEALGIVGLGSERGVEGAKALGSLAGLGGGSGLTAAEIASVAAASNGAATRSRLGLRSNPAAYITEEEIAAREGILRLGYYTPGGSGIKPPGPRITKAKLFQSPQGARDYRALGLGPSAAIPEEAAIASVGRFSKYINAGPKIARNLVGIEGIMAALDGLNTGLNQHSLGAGFSRFGKDVVEPFKTGGILGGATSGAGVGAIIGTVFGSPGIGTAIGAALGGVLGKVLTGGGHSEVKASLKTGGGFLNNFDIAGFDKFEAGVKRVRTGLAGPVGGKIGFAKSIEGGVSDSVKALDHLRQQYSDTFGSKFISDTHGFSGRVVAGIVEPFQAAEKQLGSVLENMSNVAGQELDQINKDVGSLNGPGLKQARIVFGQLGREIEKAIGSGQVSVSRGVQSMDSWLKKLDPATRKGRVFFARMLSAIQDAMAQGVISVAQGTRQMNALMDANLKALGVSAKNRKFFDNKYSGELNKLNNTGLSSTGSDTGNPVASPFGSIGPAGTGQRGLMTVGGNERMVGGDTVMAAFNGRPAVVANGESIAVFNRHQRAELNQRLADVGGLRGFFESRRKKHTDAFARGGIADNYSGFFPAPGTNYSVGQEPQIASRLDRLAHALHLHLIGLSGYRSPQHSVQVGGFPNDPHTRGAASDTPGIERVSEAVLERFGLTRPFGGAAEADHIQLLAGAMGKVIAGAGGSGSVAGAIKKATLKLVKSGVGGKIGLAADAALGKIHDAMLAKGNSILGNVGPATGGGTSGANQALGRKMMLAMGWGADQWPALKALWTRESGWNQNARNPSSGAYGIPQALGHGNVFGANPADQIRWGLNYIKGRYGSPVAAWAHEMAAGWYSMGGMTSRSTDGASDGDPSTPSGPNLNGGTTPPSTGGKKKKKHKGKTGKKNGRPVSAGPDVPRLSGLRPGGGKGKSHIPGIGKKLIDLRKLVDGDTLPDTSLQGDPNYDLTLPLYNGMPEAGGYPDLTNYLTAHPELLREFKGHPNGVAEFIGQYGEELEVLNTTNPSGDFSVGMGLYNQGVFTPGIPEEVRWLVDQRSMMKEKLLGTSGSWGGRSGQGKTKGYLADLKYLHRSWLHYKKLKDVDTRALRKYRAGHMSWQDKVDIGQQKVDLIENWLSGYRDDAVSHRMSAHAKHEKIHMESVLKTTREEIAKAKKDKTPATGNPPHKTKSESDAEYRAKLNTWKAKQRGDKTHAGRLQSDIVGWTSNLQYIDEDSFAWNTKQGMAGEYMTGIDNLRGGIKEINKRIKSIYGTRIMPPQVGDGSSGGGDSTLSDLQKQLTTNALRNFALSESQFDVFRGMAPLVGARMIGAFDHGGVVPRTGMALVHKGEFINPNPQGPYRNGQNSAASVTGGDVNLEVHLHGGLDAAVERAVMKHGPRIIKMTSEQQGRRARMIGTAPGRGR